jgi:sec-independent protein translocase protein TatA
MVESTQYIMALWTPQGLDWLWIFLIILVIFGGKKLPELARSLGKGLSQFKKGIREVEDEVEEAKKEISSGDGDAGGDSAGKDKDAAGDKESRKPN